MNGRRNQFSCEGTNFDARGTSSLVGNEWVFVWKAHDEWLWASAWEVKMVVGWKIRLRVH